MDVRRLAHFIVKEVHVDDDAEEHADGRPGSILLALLDQANAASARAVI
jgi:hypothetical protein